MFGVPTTPENESIIPQIEADVLQFVSTEMYTYRLRFDNFNDSVIVNIALFDLDALKYENGIEQILNLYKDHHDQLVNRRLNQFLLMLYIRYGVKEVRKIADNVLEAIHEVYKIDQNMLDGLAYRINTFWLQPFIRQACETVMYGSATNDQSYKEEQSKDRERKNA